jgi:hypothetical protein
MRAVLLATGLFKKEDGFGDARAVGLQTVAGKPWIQHVVEVLAERGVKKFELVLWHQAHRYEELFEDGTRWGIEVNYHFVHTLESPLDCLKGLPGDDSVWLVAESAVPLDELDLEDGQHFYCRNLEHWVASRLSWSELQQLCQKNWEELVQLFRGQEDKQRECRALEIREPSDVISLNRYFLDGGDGLLALGREVEPGVWIGRNVMLHPTAKIVPPVFLGQNSRIGAGAEVGPYASLGEHCFLGNHSKVESSVIQTGSFLGDDLELTDSLSDRDFIYQVPLAVRIPVVDADIAGRSREGIGNFLLSLTQRILAIVLFVLLAPLALGRAIYRKSRSRKLVRVEHVRQPAVNDPLAWQMSSRRREDVPEARTLREHFWADFLPGLPQAVKGSIAVVGAKPRTERELEELSSDWRARVLTSQVGLVTETLAFCGATANQDEEYLCEAYFAKNRSMGRVLTLLVRYLASVLLEPPN